MEQTYVDLHVHSTESDGTFTPEELVAAAKEAGLCAFALTDHDTTAGVAAADEMNDLHDKKSPCDFVRRII